MAINYQRRRSWRRRDQSGHNSSGVLVWKNSSMFGFVLTTVLSFLTIKYQGKGEELFKNHSLPISISLLAMLLSVFASTALKILGNRNLSFLPPGSTRYLLQRINLFCAFKALVILVYVLLYDKVGRAGFVFFFLPMFLLPNPFKSKWLKDRFQYWKGKVKLFPFSIAIATATTIDEQIPTPTATTTDEQIHRTPLPV